MARPKLSSDKTKMTLSFTEYDEDVYDYLKNTKNASRLIKELVRAHMFNGGQLTVVPQTVATRIVAPEITLIDKTKSNEVVVTKEEPAEMDTYTERRTIRKRGYADIQSNNDIGDVDAIGDLAL